MIQYPDNLVQDIKNYIIDFKNYEMLFNDWWGFTIEVDKKYIIKLIFDQNEANFVKKAKKYQFHYSSNWVNIKKIRLKRPLALFNSQIDSGNTGWIVIMEYQPRHISYIEKRIKYIEMCRALESYFLKPLGYDLFEEKGYKKIIGSVKKWSITPIADRQIMKELFQIHQEFKNKGLKYDAYQIQNLCYNNNRLKANWIFSGLKDHVEFDYTINKKLWNIHEQ